MKQIQNQFFGKDSEKGGIAKLPAGTIFSAADTGKIYITGTSGDVLQAGLGSPAAITKASSSNDNSYLIRTDLTKSSENTGYTSGAYGLYTHVKADGSGIVLDIGSNWAKAEYLGTGTVYYITGGTNRAYHNGSGNSTAIAGTYSQGYVGGTGISSHQYVVGLNTETKLDNPNAQVRYLQGQHLTANLSAGEVTDNLQVQLLDFDYTAGTISGDFEYLKIMNDTMPAVGGVARAIHSESVLPSLFVGSVQVGGIIDSAIAEHVDNAAAVAAGLAVGTHYRTGDLLKIVH